MVQEIGGKAQGCWRYLSTAFKGLPACLREFMQSMDRRTGPSALGASGGAPGWRAYVPLSARASTRVTEATLRHAPCSRLVYRVGTAPDGALADASKPGPNRCRLARVKGPTEDGGLRAEDTLRAVSTITRNISTTSALVHQKAYWITPTPITNILLTYGSRTRIMQHIPPVSDAATIHEHQQHRRPTLFHKDPWRHRQHCRMRNRQQHPPRL